MPEDEYDNSKKAHVKRKAGKKAEKKKGKEGHEQELTAKQRNPKAFAVQNITKTERRVRRKGDISEKRAHQPTVDRTPVEPPPVVVAIVGPPKVGKTTLLQGLVKNFTRQNLATIQGPVTVVSGKQRRLTFIECPNDINSMIDVAKVADLVLLLVDASFGFEMEIFEFLNICQVHGFPRVMGVLTHLDTFKNAKALQRTKKNLKQRFWTEVYQGAKLFYLSGMVHGKEYHKTEVHNLGRFISVMKFRPLAWRSTHPHLLADRLEDLTPTEDVRTNPTGDRKAALYGYLRGTTLKGNQKIHLAGVGDFPISDLTFLPDPCPLPGKEGEKKKSLVEKDRTVYAPMSGVGGVVYDKDAVYIELGGSQHHKKEGDEGLVGNMMETETTINEKLEKSELRLFSGSKPVTSEEHREGRRRIPGGGLDLLEEGEEDESDEEEGDDEGGDDGEEEEDEEDDVEGDSNDGEDSDGMEAGDGGNKIIEEEEKNITESKPSHEVNLSKRPSSEEQGQKKPSKKMKVTSVNEKLKKELGGDFSDADSEEEEALESVDEKLSKPATQAPPLEKSASDGVFHKRLTTLADKKIHSRVSEALGKITEKEEEVDNNDSESDSNDDNESESEDEDNEEDENEDSGDNNESDDDDEMDDGDEEGGDEENIALNWKEDLAMKARDSFYARQSGTASLRRLVYGQQDEEEGEDEKDTVGGLFTLKNEGKLDKQERQGTDCTVWKVDMPQDWELDAVIDRIRDCFVTGNWSKGRDAEELMKLDDEEDEVYGDFEDLETGKKVDGNPEGDGGDEDEDEKPNVVNYGGDREKELAKRKERMERKLKLKRQFDSEYDGGDGDKNSYYDDLKKEVDEQAALNRGEFEGMEDSMRVQYEGHRPGMYVRIEVEVPCELMEHHQPAVPLLVGGLNKGEDQLGFLRGRIKKHRWYPKILKNRDPLIISLGWRRFQSLPIYSICDHNMRHRMLKYTPEHLHCDSHWWGPVTPQGTGFLAIQSVADRQENFKIVATGVILELDKSTQIVKKLKLTGEPYKIFKKTAFVKGMFNTSLEVAKFEKAAIRTVSGVRGIIKKCLASPEGAFRATFEDKILMSDIVFVKTWFQVEVPKFYTVVTNLLMEPGQGSNWSGMRTVGQIKREGGIRNAVDQDSLYKDIKREPKAFKPLQIPRNLQADLPYNMKPKIVTKGFDPTKDRVAVVLDHKERKVQEAFKMLREIHGQKMETMEKEKKKRVADFIQKKNLIEEKKLKRQKEARKQISRMASKSKAKEERMANRRGRGKAKDD